MIREAVTYSYANARARAIRSRRLSPEDWHFLRNSSGLDSLLRYLATTSYAPLLPEPAEPMEEGGKRHLERALYRPLMGDYAIIARALRGKEQRHVISALFSRFEAENLKILMRSLFAGRSIQEVEHLFYPLGRFSRIPWHELWTLGDISSVAKRLARTIFGPSLRYAFPQFEAQARLFPLEMALDHACFHELDRAVSSLPRWDRRAALRVTGPYIDMLNISWIIRLRIRYGLQPEQIVNYTLPGGELVTLSVIGKLALAAELDSFIHLLPAPLVRRMERVTLWESVDSHLHDWFMEKIHKVFVGYPFNLGIEIACLLEEEMEVRKLTSLVEAASGGAVAIPATEEADREEEGAGSHVQTG